MPKFLPLIALGLLVACGRKEQSAPTPEAAVPEAFSAPLSADQATDPVALAELAETLDLELVDPEPLARQRGGPSGDGGKVWVLYPRGNVRLGDLKDYRIDVDADWEDEGTIEFRRGR